MRDLFDDFMEELRQREAAARGEDAPARQAATDDAPDEDAGRPGAAGRRRRRRRRATGDADDDATTPTDEDADGDRPEPITDARRGARRPRRRGPGGPDDGGPGSRGRAGRPPDRPVARHLALVWRSSCCSASGSTCGPTRCGSERRVRSGLLDAADRDRRSGHRGVPRRARSCCSATSGWPAGCAAAVGRWVGGRIRSLVDRINEAAQAADQRRGGARSPFGGDRDRVRRPLRRRAVGSDLVFEGGDLPDLTPARGLGPRRHRAVHRPAHRRLGVGRLGDRPAVDPPGPVLADSRP